MLAKAAKDWEGMEKDDSIPVPLKVLSALILSRAVGEEIDDADETLREHLKALDSCPPDMILSAIERIRSHYNGIWFAGEKTIKELETIIINAKSQSWNIRTEHIEQLFFQLVASNGPWRRRMGYRGIYWRHS